MYHGERERRKLSGKKKRLFLDFVFLLREILYIFYILFYVINIEWYLFYFSIKFNIIYNINMIEGIFNEFFFLKGLT